MSLSVELLDKQKYQFIPSMTRPKQYNYADDHSCPDCRCFAKGQNIIITGKLNAEVKINNANLDESPDYCSFMYHDGDGVIKYNKGGHLYNINEDTKIEKLAAGKINEFETVALCERSIITVDEYSKQYVRNSKFGLTHMMSKETTQRIINAGESGYDYNYDKLYFDIETASYDSQFAGYENDTAFVTVITFLHNGIKNLYTLFAVDDPSVLGRHQDANIVHFKSSQEMCIDFLKYLRDIQRTTIVMGFNSSSSSPISIPKDGRFEYIDKVHIHQLGFDIPMIMKVAGVIGLNIIRETRSVTGGTSIVIAFIEEFPNCLIADYKHIIQGKIESKKNDIGHMPSLQKVLSSFGLQGKDDITYAKMNEAFLYPNKNREYLNKVLQYAIQDVVVLDELENKTRALYDIVEYGKFLGVGLYNILYKSDKSMIQWYLQNRYVAKGLMLPQKQINEFTDDSNDARFDYEGAYTYAYNDSDQTDTFITDVFSADYKSLYPFNIIRVNISPECLMSVNQNRGIKINDKKLPYMDHVEFSSMPGVFTELMTELMEQKDKYDTLLKTSKDRDDINYYSAMRGIYKLIANSSYGLLGNTNSKIFNKYMAASVTQSARDSIHAAIDILTECDFDVVYVDTDSCFVTKKTGKITKQQFDEFIKTTVQTRINSKLNYSDLIFEPEDFQFD